MDNVFIYRIYTDMVSENGDWKGVKNHYSNANLSVEEISNEKEIPKCLFFGGIPSYLNPVVPFKWKGKVLKVKYNNKHLLSHALFFEDTIEVKISKYMGKIENNKLIIPDNDKVNTKLKKLEKIKLSPKKSSGTKSGEERGRLPAQTMEVIDIEWKEWERNYPKGIDLKNILFSWLLLEPGRENVKFGEMWSYEKIGLWNKDSEKPTNLSTLKNCFLSCSSRRILITRSASEMQPEIITVPTIEITCWAEIGLVGASLLIEELDEIEKELKGLFEQVAQKAAKVKTILKGTSKLLKALGEAYRKGSIIQKFFSGYPLSSPVAGLTMETFSRLSGAAGMIKALQEKLENAYRLYQLYQQYYYFKEMDKLESGI